MSALTEDGLATDANIRGKAGFGTGAEQLYSQSLGTGLRFVDVVSAQMNPFGGMRAFLAKACGL